MKFESGIDYQTKANSLPRYLQDPKGFYLVVVINYIRKVMMKKNKIFSNKCSLM
jgi:hypothetical protein